MDNGDGVVIVVILILIFLVGNIIGDRGTYKLRYRIWDSLKFWTTRYCPRCGKDMLFIKGYNGIIIIISLLLIISTNGRWIVFVPFYPKRCVGCGLNARSISYRWPYNRH